MARVTGVRAEPGGPVALRFAEDGYRVHRRGNTVDWLLDDVGCFTSFVVAAAFGVGAVYAHEYGHTVLAIVLGVLAVPGALVVTVRALAEVASELFGFLMIVLLVLMSPLLVFPGVRRWARARFGGSDQRAKPALRDRTPADAITDVEFHRDGETLTVLVRADGESVRYRAVGADGEQLERAFRTLLADRLRIPG